jgi:hypothetical protein
MSGPFKFGNDGILPFPFLICSVTCSRLMRSKMFTSDGIAGGDPARLMPWHTAH